jgi:hypothetical protein
MFRGPDVADNRKQSRQHMALSNALLRKEKVDKLDSGGASITSLCGSKNTHTL